MTTTPNTGGPAFPTPYHPQESAKTTLPAGMSLREYAAIHLRVPASGTDWLDEMIRQRLRDDLATTALQGLIARERNDDEVWSPAAAGDEDFTSMAFAERANLYADAMLTAREA